MAEAEAVEEEQDPKRPLTRKKSLVNDKYAEIKDQISSGTHDPNYQTMAGVGDDAFGEDKKKVYRNHDGSR